MDLYSNTSYEISELITKRYSTSFTASSRLFSPLIRRSIYAIYGLVRIGDEIVDTYKGKDAELVIKELQQEISSALKRGYSTNPVVHAFATTVIQYKIEPELIEAFFHSMAMDLHPVVYTKKVYKEYIYGSAEVVGLMCLRVFCEGDERLYKKLQKGASALGSAYQKVNFLRDMAADYYELGRVYFPDVTFETFDDAAKQRITLDIEKDFSVAKEAVAQLPAGSRRAVEMSVVYYEALLEKLKRTSSVVIKQKRIRISNGRKLALLVAMRTRRSSHGS